MYLPTGVHVSVLHPFSENGVQPLNIQFYMIGTYLTNVNRLTLGCSLSSRLIGVLQEIDPLSYSIDGLDCWLWASDVPAAKWD